MKLLNFHNYKILNRALLKSNQEFEKNLINEINKIYSKKNG